MSRQNVAPSSPQPDIHLQESRARALELLAKRVHDRRVLDAFARVPREDFLPAELVRHAYDDSALPIGCEQTISQPLMVALMLEAAEISREDSVLEVGTGSGYQAALLSVLARHVISVERVEELTVRSADAIRTHGYENVDVRQALDVLGWPPGAPYDVIVVAAGSPHVPRALTEQLAEGGRLVIPVGDARSQELVRVRKLAGGLVLERLGACAFVPLVGRGAWEMP